MFASNVTEGELCLDDTYKILCDVQTCTPGQRILDDTFNLTELEEADANGVLPAGCNATYLTNIINATLDEVFGCEKVKGYYEQFVFNIVCDEFDRLFTFTLWPVGLAAVFTVSLLVSLVTRTSDYEKIN